MFLFRDPRSLKCIFILVVTGILGHTQRMPEYVVHVPPRSTLPSVTPEYLAPCQELFMGRFLNTPLMARALPCSLSKYQNFFCPPNWVKILPSLMWPQAIFVLPHWSDFLCLSPDKGWHPKGVMEKAPTEFMRVDLQRQRYLSNSEGCTNKFLRKCTKNTTGKKMSIVFQIYEWS